MFKKILLLLASVFTCNAAFAEGLLQDAVGSNIVAVGQVEAYSCPGLGLYDCSGWPVGLYRFVGQDVCFTSSEPCNFGCAALVVEKDSQQSILLVGARYRDPISQVSGKTTVCPKNFMK
ncbi:hypothetical protein EXN22_16075 [Pseudomonas tructae]|uniref:Secreted protein n=1 Tax=Pseudomonas tructae TaxID=2518644 RepID=A0A411MK06_9PSED|nr:hypothetical protein EXN22_16075 [Pseudomonas tructae]